ncbi:MAG: alanine racemase [Clostridiales Family XIII bacterium]|jgi:predicted amino acid racemase|nr:alanine racemase [Clostridiales Family XIII bacterium]
MRETVTYPALEIDRKKLADNAKVVTDICSVAGINVAGVVKVVSGDPVCARIMHENGCEWIASSRLAQLERLCREHPDIPLLLLRVPMVSEADRLVRVASMSLNSDIDVLRAIDVAAGKAGVIHEVILMIELGDLREGIWMAEEYIAVASEVEDGLKNLHLAGTGTNLGCYGSILPTKEKMEQLVVATERIESSIGRRLDIVSGGGSTSLPLVVRGEMPPRVNHLRIGEGIVVCKDNEDLYGISIDGTHRDVLTLKAEVIETRVKPSHPIGEIAYDAFRGRPSYVDRGERKRALLGVGKLDYCRLDWIVPEMPGIEILGASSDHTILDIENADSDIRVGDLLTFDVLYSAVAFLSISSDVVKRYI